MAFPLDNLRQDLGGLRQRGRLWRKSHGRAELGWTPSPRLPGSLGIWLCLCLCVTVLWSLSFYLFPVSLSLHLPCLCLSLGLSVASPSLCLILHLSTHLSLSGSLLHPPPSLLKTHPDGPKGSPRVKERLYPQRVCLGGGASPSAQPPTGYPSSLEGHREGLVSAGAGWGN